jgi:transposase-like protein
LAKAIKPIYSAPSAEAALAEVDAFEGGPGGREVPERRGRLAPRLGQGDPVLRLPARSAQGGLYDQGYRESINARLRKIIKTRGHFPSDDAATKLIWLALRNITTDWGRAAPDWKIAMNQFATLRRQVRDRIDYASRRHGGVVSRADWWPGGVDRLNCGGRPLP